MASQHHFRQQNKANHRAIQMHRQQQHHHLSPRGGSFLMEMIGSSNSPTGSVDGGGSYDHGSPHREGAAFHNNRHLGSVSNLLNGAVHHLDNANVHFPHFEHHKRNLAAEGIAELSTKAAADDADDEASENALQSPSSTRMLHLIGASRRPLSEEERADRDEELERLRKRLKQPMCLIIPDGWFIRRWDLANVVALIFTGIVTPYEVAVMPTSSEVDALYVVNQIVNAFFILDMAIQFNLAFVRHSVKEDDNATFKIVETRRKEIAKNYMKTCKVHRSTIKLPESASDQSFFSLSNARRSLTHSLTRSLAHSLTRLLAGFPTDLLSCVPFDDLGNLTNSDSVSNLRILRVVRLLRLVKLLRFIKASAIFKRMERRSSLPHSSVMLIKFGFVIVIFAHWMACVWCMTVSLQPAGAATWYSALSEDGEGYDHHFNQYCAALYWAVATITSVGCECCAARFSFFSSVRSTLRSFPLSPAPLLLVSSERRGHQRDEPYGIQGCHRTGAHRVLPLGVHHWQRLRYHLEFGRGDHKPPPDPGSAELLHQRVRAGVQSAHEGAAARVFPPQQQPAAYRRV